MKWKEKTGDTGNRLHQTLLPFFCWVEGLLFRRKGLLIEP